MAVTYNKMEIEINVRTHYRGAVYGAGGDAGMMGVVEKGKPW